MTPEHISLILFVHRLCMSALCLRLISICTARSLNIKQVEMKRIKKQMRDWPDDQPLQRPFSTLTFLALTAAQRKFLQCFLDVFKDAQSLPVHEGGICGRNLLSSSIHGCLTVY